MTKIVNRMALASGAVFLILCGLFPKLAALISIMPQSVLGGAAVMMFSSIVISGIQLITKEPMTMRNITIVSVALGLGYGIGSSSGILAHLPQGIQLIFGGSSCSPACPYNGWMKDPTACRRMRNKKNFPYEKSYVILYKLTELRAKANKYIVLRGAGKWRIPCVRKLQKRREAS